MCTTTSTVQRSSCNKCEYFFTLSLPYPSDALSSVLYQPNQSVAGLGHVACGHGGASPWASGDGSGERCWCGRASATARPSAGKQGRRGRGGAADVGRHRCSGAASRAVWAGTTWASGAGAGHPRNRWFLPNGDFIISSCIGSTKDVVSHPRNDFLRFLSLSSLIGLPS
jgi:hypothetical protein